MALRPPPQAPVLRIGFIHPDLGIGGAERLVIDAAAGLRGRGHQVEVFTSFHDLARCFSETIDGTLRVHVLGDRIVPRAISGRFTLVCAILRQLALVFSLVFSILLHRVGLTFAPSTALDEPHRWPLTTSTAPFDVLFVDQLSVGIPLLRWLTNTRVVFYCHFPDLLMNPDRTGPTSILRSLYRWPLDWLEEVTTGQADKILVNSEYTANVFERTFTRLDRGPRVVYPGIDIRRFGSGAPAGLRLPHRTLLSINRFESKKNLELAIEAFAGLAQRADLRLIVAGGFDERLDDNVRTLARLRALCDARSLAHDTLPSPSADDLLRPSSTPVLFLLNLDDEPKHRLLGSRRVQALLYTPASEHLGIVPLEAMAAGLPVLACDSGGPLETVDDPTTGRLRPPDAATWAAALEEMLAWSDEERYNVGVAGIERVRDRFSVVGMTEAIERAVLDARAMDAVRPVWKEDSSLLALVMATLSLTFIAVGLVVL